MFIQTQTEDAQLFSAKLKYAKNGDIEAISYLYQHFYSCVFGYIYKHTQDHYLAEDLASDVFEKMVSSICKIKASNEASFRAWLLKVARTTIAQHYLAHRKTIECASLETALEIPCITKYQSSVTEAFNILTEEQKQVIDGTILLGYSAEEVGRMLGKKASTVRGLQFRGLCTMKRILIAATLIILFFLGITVKFVHDASPGNSLYFIKSLGKYVLPHHQDEHPKVHPTPVHQDKSSVPLPSIVPEMTTTATSTPISTSNDIAQPSPVASPIPVTTTATSASITCVARICI
jgi:RNA polymerase sigma-70 factor (ECF subfamily)